MASQKRSWRALTYRHIGNLLVRIWLVVFCLAFCFYATYGALVVFNEGDRLYTPEQALGKGDRYANAGWHRALRPAPHVGFAIASLSVVVAMSVVMVMRQVEASAEHEEKK